MPNVVFAVPYAMETTVRFARAVAGLPGVRLGVLSQEPVTRLPDDLREQVASYHRVEDCLDPQQIAQAVRGMAQDWGGEVDRLIGVLEQLQVPLAKVRESLGIEGMGVEAACNFRDKARMKDVLRNADLPCARHALAATPEQAVQFARDCGFPLVLKPPAGAGARNTSRVQDEQELAQYLRSLPPSVAQPVLLEEFITGREFSFDSVSLNGEHLFHSISDYHPTPLEVMEKSWIQWAVLLPREIDGPGYEAIKSAGPRALTALGMDTGITHMEWFRRGDGSIAISEVAARPPGAQFTTLLSYAHDLDFYRAWARLVCFGEFEVPERKYSAGAVFLRGQGSGRVVAVRGLPEAQEELTGLIVEAKLPKKGQTQASSYEGEGFVILRHPDTEVVKDGLRTLLRTLQVELGEPETEANP